ncbi:MAG: hypothetical protein H6721_00815 [Sandaracinus sp.]|nr:hypothetical protein [Sandaracinus sp.]MCB9623662.1 hypothetical protein [Sandaracinus sp.]MCB9630685.1 hypothetical protein [Sandaracinus sp.]
MDTPALEVLGPSLDPWIALGLAGVALAVLGLGWSRLPRTGHLVLVVGAVCLGAPAFTPVEEVPDQAELQVALWVGGFVLDETSGLTSAKLDEPLLLRLRSDRWRVVTLAGALRVVPPDVERELVVRPVALVDKPCHGTCRSPLACVEGRCHHVFRDLLRPFDPPPTEWTLRVHVDPEPSVGCPAEPPRERVPLADYVWVGNACALCHGPNRDVHEPRGPAPDAILERLSSNAAFPDCTEVPYRLGLREQKLLTLYLALLHRERHGAWPQLPHLSVDWPDDEELAANHR